VVIDMLKRVGVASIILLLTGVLLGSMVYVQRLRVELQSSKKAKSADRVTIEKLKEENRKLKSEALSKDSIKEGGTSKQDSNSEIEKCKIASENIDTSEILQNYANTANDMLKDGVNLSADQHRKLVDEAISNKKNKVYQNCLNNIQP
jgi:uncharacterized membrane protein